ncbi:MAG: hypothetical protein ACRDGL_04775 [Candidatus Limnocylindrales bacterium]
MPSLRAILTAAVPGALIFADFVFWMGFAPAFALLVGLIVSAATLIVTRLLYDDAAAEAAAWAEAASGVGEPAVGWSAAGTAESSGAEASSGSGPTGDR